MKKRILSMLLILCLVIGIISTAAFAAGVEVEIYSNGYHDSPEGTFSGENRYYHNDTHEINSNPTGANAVMDFSTNTLTLNNLELENRQIKVTGGGITVVLNGTNKISYNPSSFVAQNWLLFCQNGGLAIKGPGSLELNSSNGGSSAIHASGVITISDGAKIEGTIAGSAQVISGGNVIITGEGTSVKATATGGGSGINVSNSSGTTLTVDNGATLEAVSANDEVLKGVTTLSVDEGSTVTVGDAAPGSTWDKETDIRTYKYVKIAPDTPTPDAGAFAAGGNTYATAEDAFAVANTVTLVENYSGSFTIPTGKSFDGGAYTVSGTVTNNGTITGGTYAVSGSVLNEGGTISGGTFNGAVSNTLNTSNVSYITGGTFNGLVTNGKSNGSVNSVISGGTFNYTNENSFVNNYGTITNGTFNVKIYNYKTISGGTFNDTVTLYGGSTISGGTFNESVSADGSASITGGTFKAYENSNKEDADIVYGTGVLDFSGVTDVDNFSVTIMGAFGADGVPISDTNTGAAKIILLASGMAAYRNNNEVTSITDDYSVFTKIQKKIVPTTYTVTFNANGHGTAPDPITNVTSGNTITAPTAPEASSWTFGGWYKEAGCENAWNFSTDTVTENTTLYAKWTPVVNYDLWVGGVQVTSSNASNITGAGITGSVSYDNSTKTLTLNNASVAYPDQAIRTSSSDLIIELVGDNTVTGEYNNGNSTYGMYIRGDLSFTGNGSLTASSADTTAGNSWSVAILATGDITINHGCTITATCGSVGQYGNRAAPIYPYGGAFEGNSYISYQLVLNGAKVSVASENADGSSPVTYNPGSLSSYKYLKIEPASTYTVTFDANGHGTAPDPIANVTSGSTIASPTAPEASGWTFGGWYKEAGCENAWNFSTDTVDANTTLYAKWTQNEGEKDAAVDITAAGSYADTTVSGWGDLATKDEAGNPYAPNVVVEVKLTVTAQTESTAPAAEVTAIKNVASGKTLQFLDLTLSRKVGSDPVEDIGDNNTQLLTIVIPFQKGNKQNITVYRYHGTQAEVLTENPNAGMEGFAVGSDSITIYAKKFSTYAIGYTVPASTPTPNPPIYVPTVHNCTSKCDICGGCEDANCNENACKDKCRLLGMNFTDVADGKWYTEAVEYVYHHKMMEGVSNNLFDINGTTTRAMIVTILWRLEGEPVVNYLMQFDDIPAETWYTEAVRWAASEKIVEGWNGKFNPMGEITREQFATILWRYAKYKGYDVSVGEDTNILSYEDAFSVSEYAIPAMQWACGAGLMQGNGVNLTPKADATRAQAAALFQRFCEKIIK